MVPVLLAPASPRFALDYVHVVICCLLSWLGLHKIHTSYSQRFSQNTSPTSSVSARRVIETLSVFSFRDLAESFGEMEPDVSCAVCLSSFAQDDEIRKLCNCRHIFHRVCLDKWVDHHQTTCPLCRCSLLPENETQADNEEKWT
ncbi:hypothetical protein SUGI_1175880 [Cryptomeria japonica]|uniref:brassinosteroid-responsive RING protein 1-like n=1 Tax=Cryptomeria japonica TaxID=3369 RepID=UPI002414C2DC|nr:brassinosteroid-responsive RING protein 1-like [Cryptomeria japonica]GLJ54742.1 hypothetical protein SUGI_1175880 [Cryptomeria japonica]